MQVGASAQLPYLHLQHVSLKRMASSNSLRLQAAGRLPAGRSRSFQMRGHQSHVGCVSVLLVLMPALILCVGWPPFLPGPAGLLDAALSHDDCSLVLTTYEALRLQRELLLPVRWGVAVLDEGHKIRNPDAEVRATAAGRKLCFHGAIPWYYYLVD